MIRSIFLYLDRTYAMTNSAVSSIWYASWHSCPSTIMWPSYDNHVVQGSGLGADWVTDCQPEQSAGEDHQRHCGAHPQGEVCSSVGTWILLKAFLNKDGLHFLLKCQWICQVVVFSIQTENMLGHCVELSVLQLYTSKLSQPFPLAATICWVSLDCCSNSRYIMHMAWIRKRSLASPFLPQSANHVLVVLQARLRLSIQVWYLLEEGTWALRFCGSGNPAAIPRVNRFSRIVPASVWWSGGLCFTAVEPSNRGHIGISVLSSDPKKLVSATWRKVSIWDLLTSPCVQLISEGLPRSFHYRSSTVGDFVKT